MATQDHSPSLLHPTCRSSRRSHGGHGCSENPWVPLCVRVSWSCPAQGARQGRGWEGGCTEQTGSSPSQTAPRESVLHGHQMALQTWGQGKAVYLAEGNQQSQAAVNYGHWVLQEQSPTHRGGSAPSPAVTSFQTVKLFP